METLIDNNFLNGKLTIVSWEATNMTIGRLTVYDEISDTMVDFLSCSTCKKPDTFNKNKGIKIVRLKLAKQYYAYIRKREQKALSQLEQAIKKHVKIFGHANRKLNNIEYELTTITK